MYALYIVGHDIIVSLYYHVIVFAILLEEIYDLFWTPNPKTKSFVTAKNFSIALRFEVKVTEIIA